MSKLYCYGHILLKINSDLMWDFFPPYFVINVTDLCAFIYCVLVSELNRKNEIVTREKKTYQSTIVSNKS